MKGLTLRLHHVVLRVDDLEKAVIAFEALGFSVTFGGQHESSPTENALIHFRDGTYIELFCFTRPRLVRFLVRAGFADLLYKNTSNHLKYRFAETLRFPPGLVDFAVCHDAIESCAAVLGRSDIACTPAQAMARVLPSGGRLQWRMVTPFDPALPLFVGDFDFEGDSKDGGGEHENAAVGIANIDFAASHLQPISDYWRCLGFESEFASDGTFSVEGLQTTYHPLAAPDGGRGIGGEWFSAARPKPVRLDLFSESVSDAQELDLPEDLHAVIRLVPCLPGLSLP